MNEQNFVATIIISAFNAEKTINAAVASALDQTAAVEVVVVDDASKDSTAQLVQAAADNVPNLRLLRQAVNTGPAEARNLALSNSTAPWVSVLDADDIMAADRIAKLVKRATNENLDFLADDIEKCYPGQDAMHRTRVWSDTTIGLRHIDAARFIRSNLASGRGERREMGFLKPIMRRSFLDRHKLRYGPLRLGEDYDLYARALICGARFGLCDPCGYIAFIHDDSLSGTHPTFVHADLMAADDRMLALPNLTEETRRALFDHKLEHHKKWVWRRLIDAVRERQPLEAINCFRAPVPVALSLSRKLGAESMRRLGRRLRGG
ncbi:glycosyltransferase [Loktanella sp. F6476L]|uniref:glycosyltransferase family 2 protein n=1 Tax=Loktanella sp. F6476L TaxID=2926405 RepID=UPI001FF501D4|nr:glycosyltransferase family 2 protein [Loktanella sp. F6476L]MCK0122593.1 glycosyltransferase [Loktanella sp. F6476L]